MSQNTQGNSDAYFQNLLDRERFLKMSEVLTGVPMSLEFADKLGMPRPDAHSALLRYGNLPPTDYPVRSATTQPMNSHQTSRPPPRPMATAWAPSEVVGREVSAIRPRGCCG